jgi:hypothetical protein
MWGRASALPRNGLSSDGAVHGSVRYTLLNALEADGRGRRGGSNGTCGATAVWLPDNR